MSNVSCVIGTQLTASSSPESMHSSSDPKGLSVSCACNERTISAASINPVTASAAISAIGFSCIKQSPRAPGAKPFRGRRRSRQGNARVFRMISIIREIRGRSVVDLMG